MFSNKLSIVWFSKIVTRREKNVPNKWYFDEGSFTMAGEQGLLKSLEVSPTDQQTGIYLQASFIAGKKEIAPIYMGLNMNNSCTA